MTPRELKEILGENQVETTIDYHVLVFDGEEWIDMPGFRKDDEDEARDGAKILQPLSKDVKMIKQTEVSGILLEELEI